MVRLPLEGLSHLMNHIHEWCENNKYDLDWDYSSLCTNGYLEEDILGVMLAYENSTEEYIFTLIDFIAFQVCESLYIYDIYIEELNVFSKPYWFSDIGRISYHTEESIENFRLDSFIDETRKNYTKQSLPNKEYSVEEYTYKELIDSLLNKLTLYSNLPWFYSNFSIGKEVEVINGLRESLNKDINELINIRRLKYNFYSLNK